MRTEFVAKNEVNEKKENSIEWLWYDCVDAVGHSRQYASKSTHFFFFKDHKMRCNDVKLNHLRVRAYSVFLILIEQIAYTLCKNLIKE